MPTPSSGNRPARWSACKIAEWPPVPYTRFLRTPHASTATHRRCVNPPATATSPIAGSSTAKPPKRSPPACAPWESARATWWRSTPKPAWSFTWPTWASWPTARWRRRMYPSYPPPGPGADHRSRRRPRRLRRGSEDARRSSAPLPWSAGSCSRAKPKAPCRSRNCAPWGVRNAARSWTAGAACRAEVGPHDTAILYLTSGATGEPKMALVTHGAIVSNIHMGPAVLPLGPQDSHGRLSALGSHRAARGDRVAAHGLRHAGDFFRKPAQAAGGDPQGAADRPAGASAYVGAHLLHHLYRGAQAAGAGPEGLLRRARRWASPPRATAARAGRCRATSGRPWHWPIASSSAKCAGASAGASGSPPAAPRRWARTWPSSTKPSACR